MSVELALICVAIAVVGAAVQGAIGLGFGLLSAPLLAIIDTDFIPGAVLVAVLPLSTSVAVRLLRETSTAEALLWPSPAASPGSPPALPWPRP